MIILELSPMRFEPCPLNWQNRATTTNLTLLTNNSVVFCTKNNSVFLMMYLSKIIKFWTSMHDFLWVK